MLRATLALLSAASFAPTVRAQPGQLPLSPGVHPGSGIGPGTQFVPQAPRFVVPATGIGGGAGKPPVVIGPGGFVPLYGFGFGFGGYAQPVVPPIVIQFVPPAGPVRPVEPDVVLANEFPATLSVQFPAAARVWLSGKEVGGAAKDEFAFESAALPLGASHTFELKARWERNGKTYEATRTVSVRAGDRSKLIVVSGTEVRE